MSLEPMMADFAGSLSTGGDQFEDTLMVWNRGPGYRPRFVARCAEEADVVAAVTWAVSTGVPLSARAGGHSYTASSVVSDGLVIDLRGLRTLALNDDETVVTLGAGLRWSDVDDVLGPRGLAVPGGSVSKVGVAGFTLGTGLGWLGRVCGTAGDQLVSARVVLAGGEVVDTDEHRHPDLFWAIRGGCGNFGIVTEFRLRTHPLSKILAGPLVYAIEDAQAVIGELVALADDLPPEVNWAAVMTTPPPEAGLPPQLAGRSLLLVPLLHVGQPDDGERELRGLRTIGEPLLDLVTPTSWGAFQRSTDESAPDGRCWNIRSEWMHRLDAERINEAVRAALDAPTSYCEVLFRPLGGDLRSAEQPDTPFSWREADYLLEVIASWRQGDDPVPLQDWLDRTWRAQLPLSAGGPCVSHIGPDEPQERVRAAYSEAAYRRLQDVKRRYDPDNLFRSVQNIPPPPH